MKRLHEQIGFDDMEVMHLPFKALNGIQSERTTPMMGAGTFSRILRRADYHQPSTNNYELRSSPEKRKGILTRRCAMIKAYRYWLKPGKYSRICWYILYSKENHDE